MLRLLALLAGLVLLALFVLARHDSSPEASALVPLAAEEGSAQPATKPLLESPEEPPAPRQGTDPFAVPRVIGQVRIAGEAALVEGSLVRLVFVDYGSSALSAEEAHARALAEDAASKEPEARLAKVRGDGWWYVDLPGKSWLVKAEFFPAVRLLEDPLIPRRPGDRRFVAQRDAIPTVQAIERPIEQGKLEISIAVEPGLCAQGIVIDARSQERIVGAQVALKSMREPCLLTTTLEDGSFRMPGIDARDLRPVNGSLTFVVQLDGYVTAQRETPWEEGQPGLVAFRVFLEQKER